MYGDGVLEVKLFGKFVMEYNGKIVMLEQNSGTRVNRLLQMIFQAGEKGIPREILVAQLFPTESVENASVSLRSTLYRMRKSFMKAGMPNYRYVRATRGLYTWTTEMPAVVDTQEFDKCIDLAERTESVEEEKMAYLQAVDIYTGEFLPAFGTQEWANTLCIAYREKYFKAMKLLLNILNREQQYEQIVKLAAQASRIYPYDEWELKQIDALINMKHYKEAMEIYQATSKKFFEDLGVGPSKKMMRSFEKMRSHFQSDPGTFREIKKTLVEEEPEGAFFCSYPSFQESYRFIRRLIERTGQRGYLVSCTIVSGKGTRLRSGKQLKELSADLQQAMGRALRKGDMYTQYSASQFIMLLMELEKEECTIALSRIERAFFEDPRTARNHLRYHIVAIQEVSDTTKIFPKEERTTKKRRQNRI